MCLAEFEKVQSTTSDMCRDISKIKTTGEEKLSIEMACEHLRQLPHSGIVESKKSSWNVQEELNCQWSSKVTCGLLPTLRVLASQSCNSQGSICFVPLDEKMDSASHLQMTLLEAYCREIGIEVVRVTEGTLRSALGPEHTDLPCVLVTNNNPYILIPPD